MCKIMLDFFRDRIPEFSEDSNRIIINRFCYSPEGTFGMLFYDDFSCFTVERPWKMNTPFISCIPDGDYSCQWYDSPKFGRTLAVTGGSVSLFPSSHHDRDAILFHAGNWPENFEGCIGLGEAFTCLQGRMGVTNSRNTLEEFLDMLHSKNHIPLKITNSTGAKL